MVKILFFNLGFENVFFFIEATFPDILLLRLIKVHYFPFLFLFFCEIWIFCVCIRLTVCLDDCP
jgi:hypothetical protein